MVEKGRKGKKVIIKVITFLFGSKKKKTEVNKSKKK